MVARVPGLTRPVPLPARDTAVPAARPALPCPAGRAAARRMAGRAHSMAGVSREVEDLNRRLLRARDAMDRAYAQPLDVPAVAAVAHISPAHFSRCFRAVFGETPHRYLQRRRVERSMFLLRETDRSVTDVCFDVGFASLGTFSRTFREIVGETPSGYRDGHGPVVVPHCVQMAQTRPRAAATVETRASTRSSSSG